jgi:GAF domain-containing protein
MASAKHALRKRGDTWSILLGIIDRLAAARTVDEVSRVVAAEARALIGADGVTFVLREGEQCHYIDEDSIGPLWRGLRFPMSACISGWCMLNGKTAEVPDIRLDPRIPQDAYQPTFVRSLVMVPVGTPTAMAAIGVYWAQRRKEDSHVRRVMETLARCAGSAITNIRLQQRLEQNQERILVALEEADLGTWVLGMDDLALTTSLVCKAHFGKHPNDNFSYAGLMSRLLADDREELKAAIARLASHGGQFELLVRIHEAEVVIRRLELRGYSEPDLGAPAQHIMGFCRALP